MKISKNDFKNILVIRERNLRKASERLTAALALEESDMALVESLRRRRRELEEDLNAFVRAWLEDGAEKYLEEE